MRSPGLSATGVALPPVFAEVLHVPEVGAVGPGGARRLIGEAGAGETVGANYELADNMSVYARINKGAHFNNFDDLRGSNPTDPNPLLKIRNYEIGFKYQSELLFADLVGYHKQFSGLTYTPSKNGVPLGGGRQDSVRAYERPRLVEEYGTLMRNAAAERTKVAG